MAFSISSLTKDIPDIVQALLQLIAGRGNFVGSVTLTPNAATTAVSFENCSNVCKVFLEARTLAAAAEVGNGTIFVSAISQGGFVLTHANSAVTTRTFDFECVGG